MRLFNFQIPDDLDQRIKSESERTGAPMSEIARRALRDYLDYQERGHGKDGKRVDAMASPLA
jgi:predicted transcriptional regulator